MARHFPEARKVFFDDDVLSVQEIANGNIEASSSLAGVRSGSDRQEIATEGSRWAALRSRSWRGRSMEVCLYVC